MTDAVNCALHVSVNSGTDSEVEVTVDRSFNTSVHLRYGIIGIMVKCFYSEFYNPNINNMNIS